MLECIFETKMGTFGSRCGRYCGLGGCRGGRHGMHRAAAAFRKQCPRHLGAVEVTLFPHHVLDKGDLTFINEQQQFTGLGEIHLSGHKRERCQSVIAVSRHCRRRDRKQGATEAIAVGVYFLARHNGVRFRFQGL